MCGRYVIYTASELDDMRQIVEEANRRARQHSGEHGGASGTAQQVKTGEIFPTNLVPVQVGSASVALPMVWGYPSFTGKGVIFNTRIEQAAQKPFWRDSLANRRCLVPTSGFYEWQHGGPNDKQRYCFTLAEEPILYLAGIYKAFTDGRQPAERFSILTTAPNDSLRDIHNRMPVVLRPNELEEWLFGDPLALTDRSQVLLQREAITL